MRNLCLFIFFSFWTAALSAAPFDSRFVKQWDAHCQAPFGAYQLRFLSTTGDPTDDDMAVSMRVGTRRAVIVPLKHALFVSGRLSAASRGQCDSVSTTTFPDGNILVFVQRDDRPSEDRVSAILLNGQDGKVIDTVFDLGAENELAALSENAGVVRINLIRAWRNKSSQTSEPVPVRGWLRLSDAGGKIQRAWER